MNNFEEELLAYDYLHGEAIVWVPVTFLMKNAIDSVDDFRLSCPEGWEDMISHKSADTGFGHLVESMMEHGFIEKSAIGFNLDYGVITEGHHRLTAAILLGLDTVPVSRYGGRTYLGGEGIIAHFNEEDPYPIPV